MKMQMQMVTVLISLLICLLLTSPLPLPVSGETRQTFIPKSLPATLPAIPVTVPASPEQSSFDACPLDLHDQAFHDIGIACGPTGKIKSATREQCCPVLSAWFYAAYAHTALARTVMLQQQAGVLAPEAAELEEMMPVLPDDSESCVEGMQRALKERKVEISAPVNETCDLFFCYCGIRLVHRPVSVCPAGEFWVSKEGRLSAGEKVVELERSCSSTNNINHYSFASCNKCLQTLYKLKGTTINGTSAATTTKNINNNDQGSSSTISTGSSLSWRKGRMRSRDCEMMGLTWILAKNQTQYVRAVSAMLGALMEDPDGQGTDPMTCNPDQLQLPLAVDSPPIDTSDSGCGMQQQQQLIYIVLLISGLWALQ